MALEVVEKAQIQHHASAYTGKGGAAHLSEALAKYLRDPRYSEKIQSVPT